MKKIIAVILSIMVLVGVGIGQSRTVKQQAARNAVANWVLASEETAEVKLYINIADMGKVATIVVFDTRIEKNGVILYFTVLGNCIEDTYLSTNAFAQSAPNAKLMRTPQYDSKTPTQTTKGFLMDEVLKYVCKNAKPLDK